MGYTHYWTFNKLKRVKGETAKLESAYQTAITLCNKVILQWQQLNPKGSAFDHRRLSGFSAHCRNGQYGGLEVNGKQDNAHESFCLREHLKQNETFNFCKTAGKPYDTVVVACLIILSNYLRYAIDVSSDGDSTDWKAGKQLAENCTGLTLALPESLRKKQQKGA